MVKEILGVIDDSGVILTLNKCHFDTNQALIGVILTLNKCHFDTKEKQAIGFNLTLIFGKCAKMRGTMVHC